MRVRRPLSPRKPAILTRRRARPGDEHRRPGIERDATDAGPGGDPAPPALPDARERLVRESGGPQDEAHYGCACGYQFTAPVETAVACPHCGSLQAW